MNLLIAGGSVIALALTVLFATYLVEEWSTVRLFITSIYGKLKLAFMKKAFGSPTEGLPLNPVRLSHFKAQQS